MQTAADDYPCVNIALVNELKLRFELMSIDIWEVIETASTKPFGFSAFLSRSGSWRPLHPDRPLLSHPEGAPVWVLNGFMQLDARERIGTSLSLPLYPEHMSRAARAARNAHYMARWRIGFIDRPLETIKLKAKVNNSGRRCESRIGDLNINQVTGSKTRTVRGVVAGCGFVRNGTSNSRSRAILADRIDRDISVGGASLGDKEPRSCAGRRNNHLGGLLGGQ